MIRFDRSRNETAGHCMRKRFWQYEWDGTGIVPSRPSLDLAIGSAAHRLSYLCAGGDIKDTVVDARRVLTTEMAGQTVEPESFALVEGLIRGWARVHLANFLERFAVLDVEKEIEVPLANDVVLMARADMVVGRKADKTLFIWNWKTTSWPGDWQRRWDFSVPRLSEVIAIEHDLRRQVEGAIFEGLYKGKKGSPSPLIGGWMVAGKPVAKYDPRGHRFEAWNEMGVKAWIKQMPLDVLAAQFLRSLPLARNQARMDSWAHQAVIKERKVWGAAEYANRYLPPSDDFLKVLDDTFDQNFDYCLRWNRPCEYAELCFGSLWRDPLKAGFKRREPHHPGELARG